MKQQKRRMYRFECRRFLKSPLFWSTVLVGVAIGLPETFRQAVIMLQGAGMDSEGQYYGIYTAYSLWMGTTTAWSASQTIFFYLIPLLAATPYALSYLSDRRSGYIRTLALRTGKKTYYRAKFLAVFLAGGLAIALPLLVNFFLTTLYAPLLTPDPYSIITVNYTNATAVLYYKAPLLFVLFGLLVDFVYGGLMATFCLGMAQLTDFVLTVWISPLLITLAVNYVVTAYAVWNWLPNSYLIAGSFDNHSLLPMVVEMAVLFGVNWLLFYGWGSRRDLI